MELFYRLNVLSHLEICESQPEQPSERPKYVEDAMKQRGKQVLEILLSIMALRVFARSFFFFLVREEGRGSYFSKVSVPRCYSVCVCANEVLQLKFFS